MQIWLIRKLCRELLLLLLNEAKEEVKVVLCCGFIVLFYNKPQIYGRVNPLPPIPFVPLHQSFFNRCFY